jgi:copper chaperone CopZ
MTSRQNPRNQHRRRRGTHQQQRGTNLTLTLVGTEIMTTLKPTARALIHAAAVAILANPLLSAVGFAKPGPARIEVAINGMVCSFCVQGIERKLGALPATQAARVDIKNHLVDITLRPGQSISDDQLRKLIRDAGFDVRSIRRIPASEGSQTS